jgi:histidine triad (HIT) family protein
MDCIFCDIVGRKAKAEILYENEDVMAFLDIRPVNYGHTLVIPKKHYKDFLSIPLNELNRLIKVSQLLAASIQSGLDAEGFNLIVNNGMSAGQTVFHFHFHIIPRFKNDFNFKPQFKNYENGDMKKFADKIKYAVNNSRELKNG